MTDPFAPIGDASTWTDSDIQAMIDAATQKANAEIEAAIMEAVDWEMVETAFYGVIDGLGSHLTNEACTGSMAGVIDSAFRMLDNIAIYNPTNTMKFAISSNNLTDATNTVVAWCDFSSYYN